MRLYLVRHGDALAAGVDPQRPLSPKGESDIKKVAKALKKSGAQISVVFHSSLKRARQTAEIIAQALPPCKISEHVSLKPDDPIAAICEEIAKSSDDIMIAGHLPFLSNLLSQLLVSDQNRDIVDFKKGTVVFLEKNFDGPWRIKWLITPKLA